LATSSVSLTEDYLPMQSISVFYDITNDLTLNLQYDCTAISLVDAINSLNNIHSDKWDDVVQAISREYFTTNHGVDSIHPIVRLSFHQMRETSHLQDYLVLPRAEVIRKLFVSVGPGTSQELSNAFNVLSTSAVLDWLTKFNTFKLNKQQWAASEIAAGIPGAECYRLWDKFETAIRHVYGDGIPVAFDGVINARISQSKCEHHIQTFGLCNFFPEIKMSSFVVAYNPMRVNFLYFSKGHGWNIVNHHRICESVERTNTHFVSEFKIVNPKKVDLSGTLYPSEIIKLASSPNDEDDYLGFTADERIPFPRGNIFIDEKLPNWHLVKLLANDSTVEEVDAFLNACEKGGEYHDVVVNKHVKRGLWDVYMNITADHWYALCLCSQWFPDVVNATLGKYYPDPVVSRLCAYTSRPRVSQAYADNVSAFRLDRQDAFDTDLHLKIGVNSID
jgi:hypothetical protein